MDMDYYTFDALLRTALEVDAVRKIDQLQIASIAAQGGNEEITKKSKALYDIAFPEKKAARSSAETAQAVEGVREMFGGARKGSRSRKG